MNKTSKYTGVRQRRARYSHRIYWEAYAVVHGSKWSMACDTEREAALAVDKLRIQRGLVPLNILKREKK